MIDQQRIQKIIAQAGVCSRRAAEELIKQGRVTCNGEVVTLGQQATPADVIAIDGTSLQAAPREHTYVAFYKPVGVLSSLKRDPRGRPMIQDYLRDMPTRLYPVGRLDADAEGLILLTNDGDFAYKIMHPKFEKKKTYRVTLDHDISDAATKALNEGVLMLDDGPVKIDRIALVSPRVIDIDIHEGRKHIVKRIFLSQGYRVVRLLRTHIGTLALGDLQSGHMRPLSPEEVRSFVS